jgi:hypothetical protein
MPGATEDRTMRLASAFVVLLVACASSRPSGTEVDGATDGASDGEVADGAGGEDGASGPDGAGLDGASPDGAPAIDAAVDAAIDANTCPTQPCTLFPQCGCTPPLTCDIDFTDLMGTSCRGITTPGTETSACTTFTDCAAGYVCAGGRCHEWCGADSDCPQPRGLCAIPITDGTTPVTTTLTCSANCDPTNIAAGGCPAGQKCGFFSVDRGGMPLRVLDCAAAGPGAHGAACTADSGCAANTLCSTVSAQQRCRRVCNRTTGGQECATLPGTTCIGFTGPLTVAGVEYGVCGP